VKGVSDGPWEADHSPDRHHTDVVYGRYQSGARYDICLVGASELDEQNANAAHIARLSPDRIRALLARLEAAERQLHDYQARVIPAETRVVELEHRLLELEQTI
jgi:hypothetical protein